MIHQFSIMQSIICKSMQSPLSAHQFKSKSSNNLNLHSDLDLKIKKIGDLEHDINRIILFNRIMLLTGQICSPDKIVDPMQSQCKIYVLMARCRCSQCTPLNTRLQRTPSSTPSSSRGVLPSNTCQIKAVL